MRLHTLSTTSAIAIIMSGALAGTAYAQDDSGVLEEIVVTAQKREQNIQDVPISVSTIGGDTLDNFGSGGEDIRMLSARIPGLNAESSNGRVAPRFYIRGLVIPTLIWPPRSQCPLLWTRSSWKMWS